MHQRQQGGYFDERTDRQRNIRSPDVEALD